MEEMSHRKRVRDDSAEFHIEVEFDSTKAKRIRDDLLSLLDDSDELPDRDPATQDLDSVIRSFEEEISGSPEPVNFVDLTLDSGESLPELGQLWNSLGDGIELVRNSSESSGIGELWEFQDELPSYDSFGFGSGCYEENTGNGDNNEYVSLDGIFDYSDMNFGWDSQHSAGSSKTFL